MLSIFQGVGLKGVHCAIERFANWVEETLQRSREVFEVDGH